MIWCVVQVSDAFLHLLQRECTWACCWIEENRPWSPCWKLLCRRTTASVLVCVVAVCGGDLNLSGPPHMKGKRAPLIAVLTQGGSKGRPLRKKRQERAGIPVSISGPQHKWARYRKQTPTAEQTQTWWSPLAFASSLAWTSQMMGHHRVIHSEHK